MAEPSALDPMAIVRKRLGDDGPAAASTPPTRGAYTPSLSIATVPPLHRKPAVTSEDGHGPGGKGLCHPSATAPPDLATEPDILALFLADLHRAGVVGEDRTAALVYLAETSRLLSEPVSVVVKGASSSGKSHVVQSTTRFFPPGEVLEFTGMSERALVFAPQDFRHRTIVVYEAVALRERAERENGNLTAYFVRSLISEGRISYPMSVRTKDGEWTTRHYVKEGPTNVILTTTSFQLHSENETRLLSVQTNDSPEQTRRVLRAIAEEDRPEPDYRPWHELQAWLKEGERRVVVPYAPWLADNIPPVAVRLRRDFKSVLALVRAHALLHRASRERDAEGRIIASEGDYEAVRELVLPVVSEGVRATVAPTIRETVAAVETLTAEHPDGVTAAEVARVLTLDKSTARRRLLAASDEGYLVNLEDRRGRPGRYVLGEELPEEREILPPLEPGWRGGDVVAGALATTHPRVSAGQGSDEVGGGTVAEETQGVWRTPEVGDTSTPLTAEPPSPEEALRVLWDVLRAVPDHLSSEAVAVLGTLTEANDPLSLLDLSHRTGLRGSIVRDAIKELYGAGLVRWTVRAGLIVWAMSDEGSSEAEGTVFRGSAVGLPEVPGSLYERGVAAARRGWYSVHEIADGVGAADAEARAIVERGLREGRLQASRRGDLEVYGSAGRGGAPGR